MRRLHSFFIPVITLVLLEGSLGNRPVNKYYDTFEIPLMKWADGGSYKNEIIKSGGKEMNVSHGSNYSVYPVENCGNTRITFVLQLQPPKYIADVVEMQKRTCTITFTIDDGNVEVWFGLCLTAQTNTERKFDFSLSSMQYLHFNFDMLTVRVFRREGDWGEDYEMGKIEHISNDRTFTAFENFTIFLYHGSCEKVHLKQVYADDDWRHTEDAEAPESKPIGGELFPTLFAMWMSGIATVFFFFTTMHSWSSGVPFPTNRFYNLFYDTSGKDRTGSGTRQQGEKEQKSCETAEDKSDRQALDDIFHDGSPFKAPPNYALSMFDQPLVVDDDGMGLKTAVDDVEKEEKKPLLEGGVAVESQSTKQTASTAASGAPKESGKHQRGGYEEMEEKTADAAEEDLPKPRNFVV